MTLTKAFDTAPLVSALKSEGLSVAESDAVGLVLVVFAWVLSSLGILAAGQALWAVAQQAIQLAIPYVMQELVTIAGLPAGSSLTLPTMTLTKAWDTSVLLAALKAKGMPEADGLAKGVVGVVFDWLESSLAFLATSQPLWAIAEPILAQIQPQVDAELDKLAASV